MTSTKSNSNTVVGTIVRYNDDKQFGFAELTEHGPKGNELKRVFFHQSACRQVEGTPEEPILTSQPDDRRPRWHRSKRYGEWAHIVFFLPS